MQEHENDHPCLCFVHLGIINVCWLGKKKKKTFPQTPKNIISYDKMRPLDVFSNIFLFVCLFSSRETFFFFFPYILILGYNKDSYIAFELLHFKNATWN